MMIDALRRFYDRYTGLALVLLAAVGLGFGGLAAYDPARRPAEASASATATPPGPAPTQASISVAVPTSIGVPASVSEFGTIVSPASMVVFEDPAGFVSAPLGDGDAIYLTGAGGTVYAVDHSGNVLWSAALPAAPVGDLLLTPAGRLIAADRSGRLAAYDTYGRLVWEFLPGDGFSAVSGAALGPNGNLYYTLESGEGGVLQAVSPGGTSRWQTPVQTASFRTAPWVYPDGSVIFLKTEAFDADSGAPIPVEFPFNVERLLTGADGTAFLQSGPTVAAWTLADGAAVLPEGGLRYALPAGEVIIDGMWIDPAGYSWISYIGDTSDGAAVFNPDGSIAQQISSTNILLNNVLAVDEAGTLYACGWSPRTISGAGDRVTYCMAYNPGDEEPRWRELLNPSAVSVLGVVRVRSEIFLAAESGTLYALGREESLAAEPGEAAPSGAAALPNGWYWRAPQPVVNYPALLPDGTLPLLLEDGSVFFLGSDGSLAGALELPEFRGPDDGFQVPVYFYEGQIVVAILLDRVYAVQPEAGQLWEFPVEVVEFADEFSEFLVLHHYSAGAVEYLLDSSLTLHAYTPADGLLWQSALEAGLRDDFSSPAVTDDGRLYIVDAGGTLHAFDETGPAWTFHPGGSLRGASDVRLGPDGNLYYVSTNGTAGFLEAVTPDGEHLWQTALSTFRFYSSPEFVSGGAYIRVTDDFVDAATGAIVPLTFPFQVAEFIEGDDGGSYLRTGSHIIRWEIGPDGYREIRSYAVNMEGSNQFIQPFVRVYPNGVIEVQIFDQDAPRHIWVDPDSGEIRAFERPWSSIGFGTGEIGPENVYCEMDLDAMTLTCAKEIPGSSEPVWTLAIEGIAGTVSGFPPPIVYQDGRLYIVAGGVNVYMFEVEIP